jgi:hypothetical protein
MARYSPEMKRLHRKKAKRRKAKAKAAAKAGRKA